MNQWKLDNGLTMTLDGVEHRFHVRERDNRVAIVLEQPGWAAAIDHDYWYVSIAELIDTGEISEGQRVKRWRHRADSTHRGAVSKAEAMRIAKEWYAREAKAAGA